VARRADRSREDGVPGYAAELNRVEALWAYLKRVELGNLERMDSILAV
jgi:transposase